MTDRSKFSAYEAMNAAHDAMSVLGQANAFGQQYAGMQSGLGNTAKRDQSITEILAEAQRNVHTALEIAKDIKGRVTSPGPELAQSGSNTTKDTTLKDDALTLRAASHALLSALEAINGAL